MVLASMVDTALNVAKVVVGIGLLIFIHELGHFLVAKAMRVRVLKFSLGFGSRLVGFTWGETEYALSALPLGGYVKMVGENPGEQRTGDPRALSNQSAGRRALIFVAGVTMNVIGALVMFIVAFQIGVRFTMPKVGLAWGAAHEAGIRDGDEIVSIDGRTDLDFEDIQTMVALSAPGRDLTIVVRRGEADADGQPEPGGPMTTSRRSQLLSFVVRPRLDDGLGAGFPTIGIAPMGSTRIGEVVPGSAAEAAGLRPGDRLVAALAGDGPEVPIRTFADLRRVLASAAREADDGERAKPVEAFVIEVETPDGRHRRQRLFLRRERTFTFPWELGRPTIRWVRQGGPAESADLRAGDVVLAAGGQAVAGLRGLVEAVTANGDKPMTLTIRRGGETLTRTVTPRIEPPGQQARIGVELALPPEARPEVAYVKPEASAAAADVPPGSVIVAVDGTSTKTVKDVDEALQPLLRGAKGQAALAVRFTLRTPDGQTVTKEVVARPILLDPDLGIVGEYETHVRRYRDVVRACAVGLQKTATNVQRVVLTLRRILFTRSVKPETVAGPVQIPVLAYRYAKSGAGDFLYFLAILGANFAVINLLPIPILDGGQLLLLAVEKVKGSALSERTQALAQYVGLALILLLLSYVLFQDVSKLVPR